MGNDTIFAGSGNTVVYGSGGNDTLMGRYAMNDAIFKMRSAG